MRVNKKLLRIIATVVIILSVGFMIVDKERTLSLAIMLLNFVRTGSFFPVETTLTELPQITGKIKEKTIFQIAPTCKKEVEYLYTYSGETKKYYRIKNDDFVSGNFTVSDWEEAPGVTPPPGIAIVLKLGDVIYDVHSSKTYRLLASDSPDQTTRWETLTNPHSIVSAKVYDGKIFGTNWKIQKIRNGENWSLYIGDNEKITYWGTIKAMRSYDIQGGLDSFQGPLKDKFFALAHYQYNYPNESTAFIDMDGDGKKEPYAVVYINRNDIDQPFRGDSYNPDSWKGAMRACAKAAWAPGGADEDCTQESIDIKNYTDRGTALAAFKNTNNEEHIYVAIGRDGNPDEPWIYRSSTGTPGTWEIVFEPADFEYEVSGREDSFYQIQPFFQQDGSSNNNIIIATSASTGIGYWSCTGAKGTWKKLTKDGQIFPLHKSEKPIPEQAGIAYFSDSTTNDGNLYSLDGNSFNCLATSGTDLPWQPVPSGKFPADGRKFEIIGSITECEEYEINNPPTVDPYPVDESKIDCCQPSPIVKFSWNYDDPEETPQSAYQIQVFREGNKVGDSEKINSSSHKGALTLSDFISGEYSWQIKVWDSGDPPADSGFQPGPNFSVPRRGPTVDFNCNGQDCENIIFTEGQKIQFCSIYETGVCELPNDLTVCYDAGNNPTSCTDAVWEWDFDNDGTIDSNQPNPPAHTYLSNPIRKTIVLRVTDNNAGKTCEKISTTGLQLIPLPKWQEIRPR